MGSSKMTQLEDKISHVGRNAYPMTNRNHNHVENAEFVAGTLNRDGKVEVRTINTLKSGLERVRQKQFHVDKKYRFALYICVGLISIAILAAIIQMIRWASNDMTEERNRFTADELAGNFGET